MRVGINGEEIEGNRDFPITGIGYLFPHSIDTGTLVPSNPHIEFSVRDIEFGI
jgi:hypothetical protein